MIRDTTQTEVADLRLVENWLYRNGDVPSNVAIANAVTCCVLDWARQRNYGMDVVALASLEQAEDIIAAARGMI